MSLSLNPLLSLYPLLFPPLSLHPPRPPPPGAPTQPSACHPCLPFQKKRRTGREGFRLRAQSSGRKPQALRHKPLAWGLHLHAPLRRVCHTGSAVLAHFLGRVRQAGGIGKSNGVQSMTAEYGNPSQALGRGGVAGLPGEGNAEGAPPARGTPCLMGAPWPSISAPLSPAASEGTGLPPPPKGTPRVVVHPCIPGNINPSSPPPSKSDTPSGSDSTGGVPKHRMG